MLDVMTCMDLLCTQYKLTTVHLIGRTMLHTSYMQERYIVLFSHLSVMYSTMSHNCKGGNITSRNE